MSKNKKYLTVIIPFLNEGDEVRKTVESIRDSAGDDVDIILINDNSDDTNRFKNFLVLHR